MPYRTIAARLALLVLPIVLAACSSAARQPAPVERAPAPDYRDEESTPAAPLTPAPVEPEEHAPPPSPVAAYGPLLQKAADARERGDYEQALSLLERAQRIDPQSARLYLEMAAVHSDRGDTRQSRAVAERGLLYCRSHTICSALRSFTH